VASVYPKKINGRVYYYLREMGWVDGKPKVVSERYLGSAEDIAATMSAAEQTMLPERTRHLTFGDVAAAWGMLADLDVAGLIDQAIGAPRCDANLSAGTYLAIATLNRLVDPTSKRQLATWWATTAADRFTKIGPGALDHRKFWNAMHAVQPAQLTGISARLAAAIVERFDLDTSSVALDMTNFATFIDTANGKADIAQRGKAKQKRTDLRLVGLGLVVTRDGGVPLVWHAYPGNKPDVTQFTTMIDVLRGRHTAICAAAGQTPTDMTVVFDAGQNSEANFTHLDGSGLHYVGSIPASDCTDLTGLPARRRTVVDPTRFPGLSAYDTRRRSFGKQRRTILTHSPQLHAAQQRSFEQTTLAKATSRLDELAATLARGRTRRPREKVTTEIEHITANTWVRRVLTWTLTGTTPKTLRLTWDIDQDAYAALQDELFGKHVLVTDHDTWPVAEVVAAYRSQSEAEFSFRQLKDRHVVSFSPMHHWTEHNIIVHVFTCVLALTIAHLMRRTARQAGHDMSVRELLDHLAGIGETVLIYPSTGGRPKARRMLTELNRDQRALYDIFDLDRWAPRT
jgi:transposase